VIRLSDGDIGELLQEEKPLPSDFLTRIKTRPKRGHSERELDLTGTGNSQFRVILRQSAVNHLDFSIILAYLPPNTNDMFRLRRHNGLSHEHTNIVEAQTFYDYHIHIATERYQEIGAREDAFAEPTDRYADYASALRCFWADCGFIFPPGAQSSML